jgi:hypothetical protein
MLLLGMMAGMFTTSCQDMLSPDSERHSYTVAEDTLYSYWGILKSLQNIAERYVILNECRGDLIDETTFISDTIGAIINFGEAQDPKNWKDGACAYLNISDFYHIINSCNAYIAYCDTTRTTGTNKKYMIKEYAQVQAIRAWVYMQLLYAYGENRVPFYKDPMLTTDDISNFKTSEKAQLLNSQVLVDELAPMLESMAVVEDSLGLPDYNNYGDVDSRNTHFVCHSSKCMFPVSIVLGDLYLLNGDYAKAAQSYYNYINTPNCGPLAVDKYFSYGLLDQKKDFPIYTYDASSTVPYLEKSAVSRSTEVITCIPSNKGKLEGKVLTDISRLFGFEASLRTDGSESAGASVDLSLNYERELIPSKGYEALCDSQKFEMYIGSVSNNTYYPEAPVVLEGVGDARRAWIYNREGEQWNFMVGDDRLYGKMVAKQNPGRSFSSVYPVIYRKSTVWLRFAEALNRAGFPSYAFAVLKNGLCENPSWFPTRPSEQYESVQRIATGHSYGYSTYYYPVTDSLYCYFDYAYMQEDGTVIRHYLPEGWKTDEQIHTLAELEAYVTDYFQKEYEATLETEEPMEAPREFGIGNVLWLPASAESFGNEPYLSDAACYYISRSELERAANTPYLNFKNHPNLRGQSQSIMFFGKEQSNLLNDNFRRVRFPSSGSTSSNILYTIGVHQRGCGFIIPEEIYYGVSAYNYVDMVGKKLQENGFSIDEEELGSFIYDDANRDVVEDAVEDLIIDEMALELAFEGTRFSDLYRVAKRRSNPDYLAKHVAKRHTGEIDPKLRSRLGNMSSWFLPLPEE